MRLSMTLLGALFTVGPLSGPVLAQAIFSGSPAFGQADQDKYGSAVVSLGDINGDLIPDLAGPTYTRHDVRGTRAVTAEEYRDELLPMKDAWTISDFKYFLMAEGDYVTAIGTWKINGEMQWDWVQTFRVDDG